jgi:hypothetical protein
MQHLRPEDLIDLADGTRADPDVPHLAACDVCRADLADLRATIALAADADVPPPSPLFWNHFSARVSEAVAHERAAADNRGWWRVWSWPRVVAFGSAGAVAAIVFLVMTGAPATVPDVHTPTETVRVAPSPPGLGFDLFTDAVNDPEDASLTLVADLTADLGWDAAADAGLTPPGSAEHAVTHMNVGELQELQRLLQQELVGRGA